MLTELINEHFDDLNENDLHILNFISSNISLAIKSTVGEIAKLSNVSSSAISRTTQKLGFEGFSEFKYYLREENGKIETANRLKSVGFTSSVLLNDSSETIKSFEHNNNLEEIYDSMINAKRIFAFATGHAQNLMVQEFARCLLNNDIFVNILSTRTELMLVQDKLSSDDLLFVVGLSGNIPHIKPALNNLQVKKVPIVSVTQFSRNELSSMADYNLYYHVTSLDEKKNINNTSFFTLNFVLALLYEGLSNYQQKFELDK